MTRPRALVSWSSGKDSAFALHAVRESVGETVLRDRFAFADLIAR